MRTGVALVLAISLITPNTLRALPSGVAQPPPKAIRHVWTGPPPNDRDDTWAVSPDGATLAYRDEQSHLALYDLRTHQKRQLAADLPTIQSRTRMVWSPDGTRLAYNRNKANDLIEIRIASIDGSAPRIVTESRGYMAPLSWSPNSDRLLVVIEQMTIDEIAWVVMASGERQSVKRLDGAHRNEWHPKAVLSPDGRQFAFARVDSDDRNRDVFVANADGTLEVRVVEHLADDYPLAWSADGRLIFATNRTGQIDLWALPLDGRIPRGIAQRVHRDLGLVRPLGLTCSGALYYGVNLSMTDVFTVAFDASSGRVAGIPMPVARRFTGYNSAPDLSPDGKQIVYQVGLPGTGLDLVFQSLQGGEERVIHPKMQQFSRPRFDPLEAAVVVHGTSVEGIDGIFRVDKETGEAAILAASPPSDLANPSWTRDGRTLSFERDDRAVWLLDRATKQTTEVYAFPEPAQNFTSAPTADGRKLAIVHGRSLHVVDAARRSARAILRVNEPERLHDFPGSLAWMPDGQTIIFGKTVGDKRGLWRIRDDGTGLDPIGVEAEKQNIYFLRVSRDGRRIAFVMGDYDIRPLEVWVMEGFLQ
jgi:Tol biopolymer transport system component